MIELDEYITPGGIDFLANEYHWPYNVRELESLFAGERTRQMLRSGGKRRLDQIYLERWLLSTRGGERQPQPITREQILSLVRDKSEKSCSLLLDTIRYEHFMRVLEECNGNASEAARVLGVDRKTFYAQTKKALPWADYIERL
jgi:transcriptional regulator of acetoin/glycerol metabolism